jgi:hypothetical protein
MRTIVRTSRFPTSEGAGVERTTPTAIDARLWLPVYLIGMGIISWQGQYSGGAVAAPLNTGHIHFWWDMGVVAVFSLIIYFWAVACRLPRDEMLDLVNKQAGEPTNEQKIGVIP